MIRSQFKNCKLLGAFIDQTSLRDILFEDCNFNYSTFSDSDFHTVFIKNSILKELRLYHLRYVKLFFESCDLENLEVIDTKLCNLDLSSCNLSGIQAMIKDLEGITISNYQLLEVAPLFGIQIKDVDYDKFNH